nr:MAG TPA: hypothetical protein [Bacteriophage sp.]DAP79545.1 MAG TPA: hypothetical protein [Caudoviricetes sp.]DAQ90482.1 MAG TPA: hypothetical protein [Caudoviricetes sp.]
MMNIKVGVIFLSAVSCSTSAIVLKDCHYPIYLEKGWLNEKIKLKRSYC